MTYEIVFYLNGLYTFMKDYQDLLGGIITAAAALYGLRSWRQEMVGRRKAELAEEILASAYQYREVLKYIRSPFSSTDEGRTRPVSSDEDKNEQEYKRMYFVTIERGIKQNEFISKFKAHKFRFMALFGAEAGKLFDEIDHVRIEAMNSASSLMDMYNQREEYNTPELRPLVKQWKANIGWGGVSKEDPLSDRVDEAIKKLEDICRPCLSDKSKGGKS